jgi:hypothetical protein
MVVAGNVYHEKLDLRHQSITILRIERERAG